MKQAIRVIALAWLITGASGLAAEATDAMAATIFEKLKTRAGLMLAPKSGDDFDTWVEQLAATKTQKLWSKLSRAQREKLARLVAAKAAETVKKHQAEVESELAKLRSQDQRDSKGLEAVFKRQQEMSNWMQIERILMQLISAEVEFMRVEAP